LFARLLLSNYKNATTTTTRATTLTKSTANSEKWQTTAKYQN